MQGEHGSLGAHALHRCRERKRVLRDVVGSDLDEKEARELAARRVRRAGSKGRRAGLAELVVAPAHEVRSAAGREQLPARLERCRGAAPGVGLRLGPCQLLDDAAEAVVLAFEVASRRVAACHDAAEAGGEQRHVDERRAALKLRAAVVRHDHEVLEHVVVGQRGVQDLLDRRARGSSVLAHVLGHAAAGLLVRPAAVAERG